MVDDFVQTVAAEAATIWERLAAHPTSGPTDAGLGERRSAAWRHACAAGDAELYSRRLARDGFTEAQVVAALGRPAPQPADTGWARTATWVESALRSGSSRIPAAQQGAPVPFQELFWGLVVEAERRLTVEVGPSAASLLSSAARNDLQLELVRSVAELCAPILYERFRLNCPLQREAAAELGAPRGAYQAFITEMRERGWRIVLSEQPVLLRILSVMLQQWLASNAEFLSRFSGDHSALAEFMEIQDDLRIARIEAVGDLHNHGRAVRRVVLTNGREVFYKPKDLSIDAIWYDLITDLNDRAPFSLRVPRALVRPGYGWSQSVEHSSCGDTSEFDGYFRRAGGWLCLFQLFGGADMHEENIVACGNQPVPVDLETLLQPASVPEVDEEDPRRAYTLASAEVANSVLATGLLPAYGRRRDGVVIAHGGFLETQTAQRMIEWRDVNTDRMRPMAGWSAARQNQNRPHICGAYAEITNHTEAVTTGYAEYAAFLLSEIKMRGAAAFTAPFVRTRVRKLIKNTRFYALLLDRLQDPKRLTDGALWSAQLDFVSRFADWEAPDDEWWPLVAAERNALAELNIPYFTTETTATTINDQDGIAAHSGLQPGLNRVTLMLSALSPAAIRRQTEIIRLSLGSVRPVAASSTIRAGRRSLMPPRVQTPDTTARFSEQASAIAARLSQLAFVGSQSAAWLSLDWLQDSTMCQLAPLGVGLYNGVIGVAVFLAAHARVTGDALSGRLARHGLAAIRYDLLGANAGRSARALGIGGSTGLGSVIYGLAVIGELSRDPQLLSDALQISELLSEEIVLADDTLDVMDGAAGALLALVKLYRVTGRRELLHRAEICARRLTTKDAPAALMQTGLSHGPAGAALALTALAPHLPRRQARGLLTAAEMWIDLENAAFCPTHRTWPDGRSSDPSGDTFWPCQWCHGAAGIGLARIAMATQLGPTPASFRETLDRDVERAITTAVVAWPYPTDSLCCGTLGGIELLSAAGRYKNTAQLGILAQTRLCEILDEAEHAGDFLWDIADSSMNVGLFRGISGIGYTLLRQVEPTIPNLLVWE